MTWFRLDDGFHSHPKVLRAGNEAAGLFVRCGTYSAQHLTDGLVPAEVALMYGTEALCVRLVDVRLFDVDEGVDGWWIHDFLVYNPSAEQVREERRRNAERQEKFRRKQSNGGSNAVTNGVSHGVSNSAPSRPPLKGGGAGPGGPGPIPPQPSATCEHGQAGGPRYCALCRFQNQQLRVVGGG